MNVSFNLLVTRTRQAEQRLVLQPLPPRNSELQNSSQYLGTIQSLCHVQCGTA